MRALAGHLEADLEAQARRRRDAGLERRLRPLERRAGHILTADGRRLLDLSSNDYLGLAGHPAVREAAAEAAAGAAGAGASRLVTGTSRAVAELEERLAAHRQAQAALVLSSGYLANLGVIGALVGRGDAVVCDRRNHASILDGCRLSRATLYRYRHGDLADLEAKLDLARSRGARRVLVVTESVFSMDGDVAPLAEIVELKERYGAVLYLDEAHAEGVFGPRGAGVAAAAGLGQAVECHLGTFSKAYGAYGAYIAGSRRLVDHVASTARPFLFTTALPPAVVGAVAAALPLLEAADAARARLLEQAARLREGLARLGADVGRSASQIVPLLVGSAARASELSALAEARGVLAVAIRPPTVPPGTARLRLSLSAAHRAEDVERALDALGSCLAESEAASDR
ncbi:MAG TPA: 8-amino-7-oxononanoate synthase [Acidimicrobiales bacterium]|nr:8-amino-7-oxononanoate synthase [Acidimicrobiales bacterium]